MTRKSVITTEPAMTCGYLWSVAARTTAVVGGAVLIHTADDVTEPLLLAAISGALLLALGGFVYLSVFGPQR